MLDALLRLSNTYNDYSIKILVVDDRSPDGTGAIVKKYQLSNKNILLVSGKKNGLGDAYIRGMKYGLTHDTYYAMIMMDADFSHDPNIIPLLLEELNSGNDLVIGSRYAAGGFIPGNWPLKRIINSRILIF
jgi:dolichol-phosphate mannosyltransferase